MRKRHRNSSTTPCPICTFFERDDAGYHPLPNSLLGEVLQVSAFRDALLELTLERVPLQWATTQNNLGTALLRLGERERGTARLEQAVNAFRDALLERPRERVPLDWAMTQNNLGDALTTLGERDSGTARLEQAVDAYRDALLERTRERVPLWRPPLKAFPGPRIL